MEILFNSRELEKAVSSVIAAVPSRHASEAQTGILIDANKGSVSFTANNFDLAICCSIPAQVRQAGKVLVSGKLFSELVKKLPGPDITVKEDKERHSVLVECGAAHYRILMMNVNDFLPIDHVAAQNSLTVDAPILQDLYHWTAFAVANDDRKPIFTGIDIAVKNGMLAATATNTHRLARKQIAFDADPGEVIIPPSALSVVSRLIAANDKVLMAWGPGKVWFKTDTLLVSSRLIGGTFPDVDRIIPKAFVATVNVDRKQMLRTIERLEIVGLQKMDKFTVFNVALSVTDGELKLSADSSDKGAASEELSVTTTGEPINICFSGSYITDSLQVLTTENVVLSLSGPLSAATITSEEDESYVYVVTPIRIAKGT